MGALGEMGWPWELLCGAFVGSSTIVRVSVREYAARELVLNAERTRFLCVDAPDAGLTG
jgi:hypothetical protein